MNAFWRDAAVTVKSAVKYYPSAHDEGRKTSTKNAKTKEKHKRRQAHFSTEQINW